MTGWRGPLQSPSGVPPFTLEAGRQTHSGIEDALGSGSRDQGICGGFGFSLVSFAERSLGSHSLDRVESQGARHPFFSFRGHRCGLAFQQDQQFPDFQSGVTVVQGCDSGPEASSSSNGFCNVPVLQ